MADTTATADAHRSYVTPASCTGRVNSNLNTHARCFPRTFIRSAISSSSRTHLPRIMPDDPPNKAVQIDIVSVQGGRGDGNGNDRRFPPSDARQFRKKCFLCREPTDLVCRGCNIICYCSREHQIQCRPHHRRECPRGAETGYVVIQTVRYETRKDAHTHGDIAWIARPTASQLLAWKYNAITAINAWKVPSAGITIRYLEEYAEGAIQQDKTSRHKKKDINDNNKEKDREGDNLHEHSS